MNHYRVDRAHDVRAVGDLVVSDDPRDAYLMSIGFLVYLGSEEAAKPVTTVANPRRNGRGVKVGPESGGTAGLRDSGGDSVGGEDGQAG